jgi:hypothetical protein
MSDDWLNVEEADDWLADPIRPVAAPEYVLPAPAEQTNKACGVVRRTLALPDDIIERQTKYDACWTRLNASQKTFLNIWRDARFNANKVYRALEHTSNKITKDMVNRWLDEDDFLYVRETMMAGAATDVLNPNKLLLRHDDIAETLLTPKPILHQGVHTGHFEVEAGAAAKVNETLMRAAGMLKDQEKVNVNVGPALMIQVVQRDGNVIDV